MTDMLDVIIPKSDQLNSDDLIGGPITVKITGTSVKKGTEQPCSISFHGDNGKPYKPCKSMMRVMVKAWGNDSKTYIGRSMTLYRDEKVKWGGAPVGGIRISHMSGIDEPFTMALTESKANRKPFTVKPLDVAETVHTPPPVVKSETPATQDEIDAVAELLIGGETVTDIGSAGLKIAAMNLTDVEKADLNALYKVHMARVKKSQSEDS